MLRQKRPVTRDPKHLAFIRTLPCCICGNNIQTEAAHIRMGSTRYNKAPCGMQERDDDWTVPLCHLHHAEQHTMGEEKFWEMVGIDLFALAISLRRK